MKKYKVAVVGAGAVGLQMIQILEQREFPMEELRVLARSSRILELNGKSYQVQETTPDSFNGIDIALFAGTEGEKGAAITFSKEANARGAVVIDNGSDFRMDPHVPLVIPEVNGDALKNHKGIIANPNCTAATLLVALAPLHRVFGIKRAVISTYQACSGAGAKALAELKRQAELWVKGEKITEFGNFPDQIAFNVLANNWAIEEKGYSNEEWKAMKEIHKILDPNIHLVYTTVRVPTITGHGESAWIETEKPISAEAARDVLDKALGVRVVDEKSPFNGATCPMPIHAEGQDEIHVGRIRPDLHNPNALAFWAVGDNLRKGAALNAVQIAETLVEKNWVKASLKASISP